MAVSDAPITTWSDTTAHKIPTSDLVALIDPTDTPFVSYFGLEGDAQKFRIRDWPSYKAVWLEDDLAAMLTTLGASIDSATTDVTMTVADASLIKPGDVLMVDAELMWVLSKVNSTNVVTLTTRGYGGTRTTHASAAACYRVGMARLEGATADYDYKTDVLGPYNMTQIFQAGVQVNGSQLAITQWGIADELEYQRNKKIPELTRLIDRAVYYQDAIKTGGSTTTARAFGGLPAFVTTNTAALASAALTRKDIEDMLQKIYEAGGKPSVIFTTPWNKRKISSFYEGSVRTERSEERGGVQIDVVTSEFGDVQVIMDRWAKPGCAYFLTPEHIGFLPMRSFFWQELAKTGDAVQHEVIGEYTFVVRMPLAHGIISGASTTT